VYNGLQLGLISVYYVYTSYAETRTARKITLFEEPKSRGNQDIKILHLLPRLYPLDPNLDPSDDVPLEKEAAIEKELIKCEKSVI